MNDTQVHLVSDRPEVLGSFSTHQHPRFDGEMVKMVVLELPHIALKKEYFNRLFVATQR